MGFPSVQALASAQAEQGKFWQSHIYKSTLPAAAAGVEIDDWGTFRFVAVKLRDARANRQKILVRGRNGCSEANLVEELNRKVGTG